MKSFVYFLIIILIFVLGYNLILLFEQFFDLRANYETLIEKQNNLTNKEELLRADLEYYSNKSNLIKELRAKFDYKYPGEKLIKIK